MITKTNQSLSNVFDVTPLTINDKPVVLPVVADDNDLDESAQTAKDLLEKGSDVLETASLIAAGSEDPKMFSAIASLIASMNQTNSHILQVHDRKQKLIKPTSDTSDGMTINTSGAVFVGNTTDFAKAIRDMRSKGE